MRIRPVTHPLTNPQSLEPCGFARDQLELLAGIEPANLILTKDALCRLSYSSKILVLLGFSVLVIYPIRSISPRYAPAIENWKIMGSGCFSGFLLFFSLSGIRCTLVCVAVRCFNWTQPLVGALPYQGSALPTELRKLIGDPERTRTVGLQRDRLAF